MSNSEAPAVLRIIHVINGHSAEYVRRDIFDEAVKAVDAWFAWHENQLTAAMITPDHLRHDEELHQEAMNLMQAARQAGECVK
jgi:creatinine amidohydrolase/Fe(II)-dependent formamide hydrolase-like protein